LSGATEDSLVAAAPLVSEPVKAARAATADLHERADHVVGLSHCG